MTLHSLLKKIADGELVNFNQVVKHLPKSCDWQALFLPELRSKDRFHVLIKDQQAFASLLQQSRAPVNRIDAAKHKFRSSHSIGCDSAYKLVFPNFNFSFASKLDTIAIVGEQFLPFNFSLAKSAVLIENQDCFFRYQEFLSLFQGQLPPYPVDVIFACGKQILDKRFIPLLNRYESLFCLFDYDYAGLVIHKQLALSVSSDCFFLFPACETSVQDLFVFAPKNTQELLMAINEAETMHLDKLVEYLKASKRFMEQEALLTLIE